MSHTIDAATLAEGLAEMRADRERLAEVAEQHRANGDQDAATAYADAASGIAALADAIERGDGVGEAMVNSTAAYRRLADLMAERKG